MTPTHDAGTIEAVASQLDSLGELYRMMIESHEQAMVESWLDSNLGGLVEQLLGACAIPADLLRDAGEAAGEDNRSAAALAAVQAALADTCRSAVKELRSRCARGDIRDFASFYRQWVRCFESHYEQKLREPSFGRDFGTLVNLLVARTSRVAGSSVR